MLSLDIQENYMFYRLLERYACIVRVVRAERHVHVRELRKQGVVKHVMICNITDDSVKRGYAAYNDRERPFNNPFCRRPEGEPAFTS